MKNCPFCGEEIQDTAKKCKHCKEWIRFKTCSACGESVPENSEVCPCCDEPFSNNNEENTINNENEDNNKNTKEDEEEKNDEIKNKEGDNELNNKNKKKKGKLKKIRDDYAIIIIIIGLIFGYSIYKNYDNHKDVIISQGQEYKTTYTQEINSNNIGKSKYTIDHLDNYSKKNEYNSRYMLDLIETNDGFILQNDLYSCKVDERNISKFVDSVNNKGIVEYCNPIGGQKTNGDISLGIFIDNSYSLDNLERLDSTGPNRRINSISKILHKYAGSNITVYLGFLYTTKENKELSEVINNRIIKLSTEESSEAKIKVYSDKKNPMEYIEKKNKLRYEKMIFVLEYDNCNKIDENNYICYNIESLNNQIQQIYKNEFDKEELHKGNPMIEYFADQKIQGYFNKIEHAYILTDGQFEITDSYKSLKLEANKMSNFPEYKISNFYVDSYAKNRIPFERFWNNNAIKGGLGNINCEGFHINFIGLAGGNPGFTNFTHEYFANKLFTGCNVTFEDL